MFRKNVTNKSSSATIIAVVELLFYIRSYRTLTYDTSYCTVIVHLNNCYIHCLVLFLMESYIHLVKMV